ncbi:MAG: tripartite tricarboxylate transporter substrate binding protein [Clostridium sp.]|nr:tripartite tricarboxylate transporter substrate binding protein [Clostridium sp.]
MKKNKVISLTMAAVMLAMTVAGCSSAKPTETEGAKTEAAAETEGAESSEAAGAEKAAELSYPEKDIQGAIMWAAGGACDNVVRGITPYLQDEIGKTIVLTNRAGAAGGISMQYVHEQPADGYNILFGAENPQVAKVMGTSDLDYSNFIPINIFCTSAGVVVVDKDSKYNTIEELVDGILANPGKINAGTTGPGGLPQVLVSMMESVNGTKANTVVFDGEGPCITALMGGHVDYTIVTVSACAEQIRAGEVKALAVMYDSPLTADGLTDIPVITDIYPDYDKYMPWGPFYGAFVREDTPQEIVDYLTEHFDTVMQKPEIDEFLKNLGTIPSGISGDEAREFVDKYRSTTSWLLYDAGAATKSPEEFGIERP